jgi:hypothetical protein
MSNLRPNRRQLSEFLSNPQTIRAFESLFDRVLELTPSDNGGGGGDNVVIITQEDIDEIQITTGTASTKATQALILIEELIKQIAMNIFIPPVFQGSISTQNKDMIDVTGGFLNNVTIGNTQQALSITTKELVVGDTTNLLGTNVDLNDSALSNTATLTNSPVTGNPSKWISISDNGVTRYIPVW